jgi:ectoine hydroxylase-related dioxygenase (phytanoyl-CoA dioxygenase family)
MYDCARKNGTMSVLTGSHKLGFIKKIAKDQKHKKSVYSYTPVNINRIIKKFKEKFINMRLGDIVMFDENIIHKSNKNSSNKIRFVGIIRHQLLNQLA